MLNIAGLGMLTDVPEQNVARHGREGHRGHGQASTATSWSASSRRITRDPSGCRWIAPWRPARAAGVPVMVDFGYFRAERPY